MHTNDESRERYEVPGVRGARVFVTGKALRARAAELGHDRWLRSEALVKWLHADIMAAVARKVARNDFEPDGTWYSMVSVEGASPSSCSSAPCRRSW